MKPMTKEFTQQGMGNIGLQDINNSSVNITQILGKSVEYKDLLNQLETKRELLAYMPEDQTEKRLKISQDLAQLEAQIEQFKHDILLLAQGFNRIEINTDRLRRAKAHFEQGEIAAAHAVFEHEHEQMQDENNRLVREKARYEQDVLPQLKHSSEEFYVRALLERTAYDNANWLADTCEYFERSISAFATEDNVFSYALFLQNHNRFDQAYLLYQEYLNEFARGDQSNRAMALNNLAILHSDKNELAKAEAEFGEALEIRRNLAAINPSAYLPDVVVTLNNLAVVHRRKNELAEAEAEHAEALEIRRNLAAANPSAYLPDVAATLNNLAILHSDKNELAEAEAKYAEALEIYRNLAAINPSAYLPDVAVTLNNLANLHINKNELAKAEAKYAEALEIRRNLAAANPSAYLPGVAATLNNLAALHKDKNELAEAEVEYAEALEIRRNLAAVNPSAYLPNVAETLNNFANLHSAKNELTEAEAKYAEALEIRRNLATVNPSAYLPDVAAGLINVAIHHSQFALDREHSIKCAMEAVMILRPIVENAPYTQKYLQTAISLLQRWGLNSEDIERMLV